MGSRPTTWLQSIEVSCGLVIAREGQPSLLWFGGERAPIMKLIAEADPDHPPLSDHRLEPETVALAKLHAVKERRRLAMESA